jgi:putative endonuclease
MTNKYWVYILSSERGVLYIGVTGDLAGRVGQHKRGEIDGFTKRYHVTRLVYYEEYGDIKDAILREKQLKTWRRRRKIDLIRDVNPDFKDLSLEWEL